MESQSKPTNFIPSKIVGYKSNSIDFEIKSEDSSLYALCLGFIQDLFNKKDMNFTCEHNNPDYKIFPTF